MIFLAVRINTLARFSSLLLSPLRSTQVQTKPMVGYHVAENQGHKFQGEGGWPSHQKQKEFLKTFPNTELVFRMIIKFM